MITNIAKSTVNITKSQKGLQTTWNQADFTWDDAGGSTWDVQIPIPSKIQKSSVNINKVTKS